MSEKIVVRVTVSLDTYNIWKSEADATDISVANYIKTVMRRVSVKPKPEPEPKPAKPDPTDWRRPLTKADDARLERFHKEMNKRSNSCLLYTSPSPRDS